MSGFGKIAHIFPGQGSQWVGMGAELRDFAAARAVFDEADAALGFSLSALCFEGPDDVLRQTMNAQPAIMTVSVAYLRASPLVADAPPPSFVAGHSLGEYTALVAAGALDFADAVKLARERGCLMQQAGAQRPGSMLAILGLDDAVVDDICDATGAEIANINCPGQIAVSGPREVLDKAAELAARRGALRAVPLNVSGAFHSTLMRSAADGMARVLASVPIRDAATPVVANTTARPMTSADALKQELLDQLCRRVLWRSSVEWMIGEGAEAFVEIGPRQVLNGFTKRINRNVRLVNTDAQKPL